MQIILIDCHYRETSMDPRAYRSQWFGWRKWCLVGLCRYSTIFLVLITSIQILCDKLSIIMLKVLSGKIFSLQLPVFHNLKLFGKGLKVSISHSHTTFKPLSCWLLKNWFVICLTPQLLGIIFGRAQNVWLD